MSIILSLKRSKLFQRHLLACNLWTVFDFWTWHLLSQRCQRLESNPLSTRMLKCRIWFVRVFKARRPKILKSHHLSKIIPESSTKVFGARKASKKLLKRSQTVPKNYCRTIPNVISNHFLSPNSFTLFYLKKFWTSVPEDFFNFFVRSRL